MFGDASWPISYIVLILLIFYVRSFSWLLSWALSDKDKQVIQQLNCRIYAFISNNHRHSGLQ